MKHQRQWIAILLTLATGIFAVTLVASLRPVTRVLEPGDQAPAFEARRLSGAPIALEDYRGKVLLLNVWATWCGPCQAEMPSMERLHRAVGDSNFRIVAVSVDQDGPDLVDRFARDMGLTFDILHDRAGEIQRRYRTSGVPESWVIDRQGVIVKKVIGATDWNSPVNVALVRSLLDAR
jgi:peroxiredoxin